MLRGFADKPIEPDSRYFNVSMERINFTPISLEEVKKYVRLPDSRR